MMLIRPLVLIVRVGGVNDINYSPHTKMNFGIEVAIFHLVLFGHIGLRIEIESLRCQRTESPDPVAFFPFAKGSLLPVDLLYYKNRKVFQIVAIRIEVLCPWFFQTLMVNIRPVTIQAYMERNLGFIHVLFFLQLLHSIT